MRCLKCAYGAYKDFLAIRLNEVKCAACGDTRPTKMCGQELGKLVADMGSSDLLLNRLLQLRTRPLVREELDE